MPRRKLNAGRAKESPDTRWSEPVLVQYEFRYGAKQREAVARLGFPRLDESHPGEWICPFQIHGLKDNLLRLARSRLLERRVPLWLWLLILFRDGCMAVGALVVRRKRLELPAQPSRIGKYATFSLTLLVVLGLADQIAASSGLLHAYTQVVGTVAGLCVIISTVQYFARFGYLFFAPARVPR